MDQLKSFSGKIRTKTRPKKKRVSITLPRMAFELNSIQYDNTRKISTMQKPLRHSQKMEQR